MRDRDKIIVHRAWLFVQSHLSIAASFAAAYYRFLSGSENKALMKRSFKISEVDTVSDEVEDWVLRFIKFKLHACIFII